jgi:branched-chain amino acid transport system substrate-binding protein
VRRSSKATMLILALLSIGSGAALAAHGTSPGHAQIDRIAALLDLQGAQASLGRPAMNGFVLGLQQATEHAAIPFAALLDTESDPAATAAAASNVVSSVSVAAGFTDNDSVLIAGPVFQQKQVALLSIGATDPALPDAIGDHIFLTPFGDNTQAAAAAEFGQGEFGNWVAIVWDATSQYTRTLPQYFRTRFEQLGGTVAVDVSYAGGCDISALGRQVAAQQPDFVYLAGLPDCIGDVVASLRAAGVTQPILGGDGFDTPQLLDGTPGPTTNVWFTTHAWLSEESGTPAAKAFIAAYRSAYGAAPTDAFAALGYDAARLLIDALQRAQGGKRGVFNALVNTTGFEGVTGTISFSAQSHVPLKTVWIVAVHDGAKSLARDFIPNSVPPPILGD